MPPLDDLRPAPRLSPKDEADLTYYLGQTTFGRSPMGGMLEAAANVYRDSEGHVVPRAESWRHMAVKGGYEASGYEPDDRELRTFARAARRLTMAREVSPLGHHVLSVYYGHPGARWAREPLGRVWSLTPLTHAGQGRVKVLTTRRRERGQPTSLLDAAEQLAEENALQRLQPTEERATLLRRLGNQAEELLREGRWAWFSAGIRLGLTSGPKRT